MSPILNGRQCCRGRDLTLENQSILLFARRRPTFMLTLLTTLAILLLRWLRRRQKTV
jgi:hypothetical protein